LFLVSYSILCIHHHPPPIQNYYLQQAPCHKRRVVDEVVDGGGWGGAGVELGGLDVYPPFLEPNCGTDWERWRRRPCLIVGETSVELERALRGGSIVLESGGSRERQQNDVFWASVTPIETTADVLRVGCVVYVGSFQP